MKKWICFLLSVMMLLTALVSCGGKTPPVETVDSEETKKSSNIRPTVTKKEEPTTELPDDVARITKAELPNYVIVYPAKHSDELEDEVYELQEGIERSYGVRLKVVTDDIPEVTHEILIGNTNREESSSAAEGYRFYDFGYFLLDKKLTIVGYSEEGTISALDRFKISHVLILNKTQYFYTADKDKHVSQKDYAHDEVLLNGVDILKYRLVYPQADKAFESEMALKIQHAVIEDCGYMMEVVSDKEAAGEYEILIGKTNRTAVPQTLGDATDLGAVAVTEKTVLLCGNNAAGNVSAANVLLNLILSAPESDERTLSLTLNDQTASIYGEDGKTSAMSFNVLVGNPEERMDSVIGTIIKYLPDTVGVQEASTTWLNAMKSKLSDYYEFVGFGRESSVNEDGTVKNNHGEGTYVLYAKDKFDLELSKTEWLSATPAVPQSKYEGQQYLRVVTWALLTRKSDNQRFVHCNTHLDFDDDIQKKEVFQVTKNLKPYTDAEIPVIITGDFNMTDKAPAFAIYGAMGYTDSKTTAAKIGVNCGTFPGSGQVIDFVMCNDFLTVDYYTVVSERICNKQSSDHYPVYVEFCY